MLGFSLKLCQLKKALRDWNWSKFMHIKENLKAAEARVKEKKLAFYILRLDSDLIDLNQAQAFYLRSLSKEEAYWKQKPKAT